MNLPQSRIAPGIIIVGMIVMTIVAWPLIPPGQPIPIHFTLDGTPNRFAPREIALLILPALSLVVGFMIGSRGTDNAAPDLLSFVERPQNLIQLIVLAVFAAGQALIIGYALRPELDLLRPFFGALGVLIVVLGAVTGRVKPNAIIGIRTPWTRGDPRVWHATQRFGSAILMITGVVLIAAAALLSGSALVLVMLADVVVAALACTLYSYLEFRSLSGTAARGHHPDGTARS